MRVQANEGKQGVSGGLVVPSSVRAGGTKALLYHLSVRGRAKVPCTAWGGYLIREEGNVRHLVN